MPTQTPRVTKRADAVRNVERILEAAIACLTERPTASMADIAKRAGLGRVTLYGHFASRAELLEAVVKRVLEQGDRALSAVDLSGGPRDALRRLIESSWIQTSQAASIIAAAEEELPPGRMQELHTDPAARV
ncbi:TetR/AcrR family transcriptional regulator, partial [Rhodococcus sp. (in: high G+C Gram-positive bacteria)]|uniref:TetR/AcrR family transcriptional regulator n=1 Tax=Rhodococcus sp. TaxID=1831 RepID=UPI00388E9AF0